MRCLFEVLMRPEPSQLLQEHDRSQFSGQCIHVVLLLLYWSTGVGLRKDLDQRFSETRSSLHTTEVKVSCPGIKFSQACLVEQAYLASFVLLCML